MKKLFTVLLFIMSSLVIFGQNEFDLRFNLDTMDCREQKLYINVDVRANSDATAFAIAEQNYRFSFNRNAITPDSTIIHKEGELSGFVLENNVLIALYAKHNLAGSLDTVVSYNVELQGGDGIMLTTDWITAGTLSFDVIDTLACLNLTWHNQNLFPPTFISTSSDIGRVPAVGRSYINDIPFSCFSDICLNSLPVELSSFDAVNGENCSILLEWTTATESSNDYFSIEKSTDGINYKAIGTIKGAGNSTVVNTYTFTDPSPSLNNYYRLKQIDIAGVPTISSQLVIKSRCFDNDNGNTIEVFPNPIHDKGIMKFYNTLLGNTEVELRISDALGKRVHTETLSVIDGANLLHFNTNHLISGIYFVQLQGNDWLSTSQKIVKID